MPGEKSLLKNMLTTGLRKKRIRLKRNSILGIHMKDKITTIKLRESVKRKLAAQGKKGDSYNDITARMLKRRKK